MCEKRETKTSLLILALHKARTEPHHEYTRRLITVYGRSVSAPSSSVSSRFAAVARSAFAAAPPSFG